MDADIVQFLKHIMIGLVRSSFEMEVALPYAASFVVVFGAQESLCIPVNVRYEVNVMLFSGKLQHDLGDFRSFLGWGSLQYFGMNRPIPLFSGIHLLPYLETTLYAIETGPITPLWICPGSVCFLFVPSTSGLAASQWKLSGSWSSGDLRVRASHLNRQR